LIRGSIVLLNDLLLTSINTISTNMKFKTFMTYMEPILCSIWYEFKIYKL
jgi:hypothetical protein